MINQIPQPAAHLFHIVARDAWEQARDAGIYQPASLETEEFIHLSEDHQIVRTANRFYQGQSGLVLLVIDSAQLMVPLQYDDVPGHGTFPHLYGSLNIEAVTAVLPFPPNAEGTFTLPEGLTVAA